MEVCICGNVLDSLKKIEVRMLTCRCAAPGGGKRQGRREEAIPRGLTKGHYDERKKLGLPLMTDAEKSQFGRSWG